MNPSTGPENSDLFGSNLLFFCLLVGTTLSHEIYRQALWQFAHPRAKLTPNFNRSHLVALAALVLVWGIGWPVLYSWSFGTPLLPILATTSAVILISSPLQMPLGNWFWIILFFGQIYIADENKSWLLGQLSNWTTPISLTVLLGSSAQTIYWFWKLTQFDEEDRLYTASTWQGANPRSAKVFRKSEVQESSPTGSAWERWLFDTRLVSLSVQTPLWRKLRVVGPTIDSWTAALVVILGLQIAILAFSFFGLGDLAFDLEKVRNSALFFAAALTVGCPIATCAQLRDRLDNYRIVQLFPMTRRQWINCLFGIAIVDSLVWWAVAHLSIGLLLLATGGIPDPGIVVAYSFLSFSVLSATFALSLVLQSAQFWPALTIFLSAGCGITLVLALIEPWWATHHRFGQSGYILGALALLLCSLSLILAMHSVLQQRPIR